MSEIFNFEKSPLEELRDLIPGSDFDVGFDVGTSPHGLSAQSCHAVPRRASAAAPVYASPPSAKPVLTFAPATPEAQHAPPEVQQAPQGRAAPNVYTSAKADCRSLQQAACAAQPPYYLRLSDREFLQVYSAVEHDRSRTRKAIGKGLCEVGDLRASDPLWQILQDVMTRRMKGYRL